MLEALELDLAGKTFTADALLTQTELADFLIGRGAHYLFAVKGNRPNLLADLEVHFRKRGKPDFQEQTQLRHGRIESRAIWTTATLNDYLAFPQVGQAFLVERTVTAKTTGKQTVEYAYGITSHSPNTASAERLLALNRGHWTVEATHHILDCCWDEDRCRIRTGHGPENTTRLRRFAIGVIRSKSHCGRCAGSTVSPASSTIENDGKHPPPHKTRAFQRENKLGRNRLRRRYLLVDRHVLAPGLGCVVVGQLHVFPGRGVQALLDAGQVAGLLIEQLVVGLIDGAALQKGASWQNRPRCGRGDALSPYGFDIERGSC